MTGDDRIGLVGAIALVMGNMIGSGVFLLPASLAPYGWNAVAGWIVTIGGALCVAYVLSGLSRRHDRAIGVAELVEHSFGRLMGFLIAFSFWVSVWATCATIAVAAVSYLSDFLPALGAHPALSAIVLIWIVTGINAASVRLVGQVQFVTTALKLLPLLVVGLLIPIVLARDGAARLAPFPAEGLRLSEINVSAALALWAMIGFESACAAAHKITDARRTVPRAIMVGAALTGILYLIICSGITLMLPADLVAGSPAPFAIFVATYWAPGPAAFVGLFAAIAAIGAVNGWTLLQGEMPLEMARRGMMPRWFGKAAANGIGVRNLLVSSGLASLLIFANSDRAMGALFAFMALLTTSVSLWLYLAVALAAIKERVALPIAIVGLAYTIWSLIGAGWDADLYSFLLMIAGLPLYWLARRERSETV